MPDVVKLTTLNTAFHARQVGEVITAFLKDTDYPKEPKGTKEFTAKFHGTFTMPGDPLRLATLVYNHIPLRSDTAPAYIPTKR